MNQMLKNYIAVNGMDNALKMAKALMEQNFQVMIQLDDCDVYIVAYETNEEDWGNKFCVLDEEEMDVICKYRADKLLATEIEDVKNAIACGDIFIDDLNS